MDLGLLFWILAIVCLVFGFWSSRNAQFAPYSWGVPFILILILGWKVFGPALHLSR
jgi:hypothetical protein